MHGANADCNIGDQHCHVSGICLCILFDVGICGYCNVCMQVCSGCQHKWENALVMFDMFDDDTAFLSDS